MASLWAAPPNVLVFLTDDQGWADVRCYGSEDLKTPAMDRLAGDGVRFTRAYAHTVCCPARAALLTGRHPQRSNINLWTQSRMSDKPGRNLAREEATLAEVLKAAGYRTALFGKWHLGAHPDHLPTRQGFDEFFGIANGFIENTNHYFLHGQGYHDLYDGEKEVFDRGAYFPDLICDRALSFIERNQDKPFFLFFSLNLPHYPEEASSRYQTAYADLPPARQAYARCISTCDDYLGRLLARLDQLKLRENTIVLFTSDNGFSDERYRIRGDKHLSGLPRGYEYGALGGGSAGRFLGAKGSFLEGGIRVPAILSFPAGVPRGEVRDQAVTIQDWFPTILELCGVKAPAGVVLDGRSVRPLLADARAAALHKRLFWQWDKSWAVAEGDWKLIRNGSGGLGRAKLPETMLVNLTDNPPESVNHTAAHPEIVRRLEQAHEAWAKDVFQTYAP